MYDPWREKQELKCSPEEKKRTARQLWKLLIPAALIVFFISLEMLLHVRDQGLYESWKQRVGGDFSEYLTLCLLAYLRSLFYPVFFSLYLIGSFQRLGINRSFRLVWAGLGLAAFIQWILTLNTASPFYYLIIGLYLLLIFRLSKAPDIRPLKRLAGPEKIQEGQKTC